MNEGREAAMAAALGVLAAGRQRGDDDQRLLEATIAAFELTMLDHGSKMTARNALEVMARATDEVNDPIWPDARLMWEVMWDRAPVAFNDAGPKGAAQ